MQLNFTLNNTPKTWDIAVNESLLDALRRHGVFGVKHGCETGECGACTVLLDGVPVTSCTMLAAQADGHAVATVEGLGEHPEQGWKHTEGLHPLQQAFIEAGAIQCGYCTPAQLLAADALLTENPNPTEAEVREALSGVLCRCTGYVQAGGGGAARGRADARGRAPPLPGRLDPPINVMELPPAPPEAEPPVEPGSPSSAASLASASRPRSSCRPWSSPRRRRCTSACRSRRWTRSSWRRASPRSWPTSRCAACWSARSCTAPSRTATSSALTSARRARCPACTRC